MRNWFDSNGNRTGKQTMEFFAEYFSYGMTHNPKGQDVCVSGFFNDSGSFVDHMLEELIN